MKSSVSPLLIKGFKIFRSMHERKKFHTFFSKHNFAVLQMIGALRRLSCIFLLCCSPCDETKKFLKFFERSRKSCLARSRKKGLRNNLEESQMTLLSRKKLWYLFRCGRVCAACAPELFQRIIIFSQNAKWKCLLGWRRRRKAFKNI